MKEIDKLIEIIEFILEFIPSDDNNKEKSEIEALKKEIEEYKKQLE